ncbi:glycerophosphoryl diester phosphodiesterase [Paenibacillus sp. UNCCL117]|uniref:glycerophosphodiester phosphodiesterase n=1 Tax=unclassified Paenibacillus TaxID=185978 RepID=UPI00088FDCAD|nr:MULTISPECIES: glycerophosphodiester phosphodiesterase family protein [unclassified Paenibacillus]SDD92227.1 glycerophosphoryl diester phosphodiesterase [Paenibacillus sp. cl123]SFW43530.1 glycerophosphoryl diester phosphodiesterase [Paenibacillus sp. UNCCL117]
MPAMPDNSGSSIERKIRPLIIGHRGAAGEAPENTLASFRLALEQGADALELDIHETADGQLIVCHDHTVDRTTDRSGSIRELTLAQLGGLDAGSWFSEQFAGERLPLLADVFAATPPRIMVNVEVKCSYSPRLSEELRRLLKEFDRQDTVVVSAFSHKTLQRLKQDMPSLKVGLLYVGGFVNHAKLAELSGMEVYSLHPHVLSMDAEDVAQAVSRGLQVYPYTVNDREHLIQAVAAGFTGIITDYPGRLKDVLEQFPI